MSLPKQLTECFDQLKLLDLRNSLTKESAQAFVDILNQSIPPPASEVDYAIYCFNRTKYLMDPKRFLADIRGFRPYDSMILWADYNDILLYFGLEGNLFLSWDSETSRYHGHLLQEKVESSVDDFSDNMDEDMDKVYEYMQRRMSTCLL